MINLLKVSLLMISIAFSSSAWSLTECESYSHVQLAEKYSANFLKKDFQGCFSYSVNPQSRSPHEGMISIRLGDHLTKLPKGTIAKIAFETFTSFVTTSQVNKSISKDVETNLNNIRVGAKESSAKVKNDLIKFNEVYSTEAITQLKSNQDVLKKNSTLITSKLDKINSAVAQIQAPNNVNPLDESAIGTPVNKLSNIEKEKAKWEKFNKLNSMPFRSLEKIKNANNEVLADKLLKEIKNARYNKLGLTKDESLPVLEQVQKYEQKENLYNQKLSLINKNPELSNTYSSEQVKTIKTIAQELKNESERNLVKGELKNANDSIDMAYVALDISTSLPFIAAGRGLYELYTGKSLIDGHSLDKLEISIAAGMILLDLTPASVISRGANILGTLGKVGARLAERGIAKVGLEESLHYGAKYASLFADTANSLLAKGLIKYSTVKNVIEHKLFFKFIDEEAFFATKLSQNLIKFEAIADILAKEGLDATPSLVQYLENAVHYDLPQIKSAEMTIQSAKDYLHFESVFPKLKSLSVKELSVTRASEKYLPFDTSINWQRASMNTSHRATMKGEHALYTIIGEGPIAEYAARAEIGPLKDITNTINVESRFFSSDKVLDLTDRSNLELLGIELEDLLKVIDDDDQYLIPQMLGHLAKMNNYDAIILQGTKTLPTNEIYKNFILLKGY